MRRLRDSAGAASVCVRCCCCSMTCGSDNGREMVYWRRDCWAGADLARRRVKMSLENIVVIVDILLSP